MALLETPLGTVAYDERGTGDPVVLLASGAHDRHDFDELRELLPGRFRSIAPDWPAHGDSPPLDGEASAMAFADLAESFVELLAPGGAVVVGNSVGGFAAARMAARRPDLVRGLVFVDGGGFAGRPPSVRAFCSLMSRPRFLRWVYPRFAGHYMRPRSEADRKARDRSVATTRENPGLRTVCELWGSFTSPEHDLREEAPAVEAPTLVVWGRRDPVIPLRLGRRATAAFPEAELVVLETGHAPAVSDPSGFASHLVPFADRAFGRDPETGE